MNQITINKSARGHKVIFPYKPSPMAIRAFHSIGMTWRTEMFGGQVGWLIPSDRLAEAVDFIEYWYTRHPNPGCPAYGVEVAGEPAETTECNSENVRWRMRQHGKGQPK